VRAKSELDAKSRKYFLFPKVHLKIAPLLLYRNSNFISFIYSPFNINLKGEQL